MGKEAPTCFVASHPEVQMHQDFAQAWLRAVCEDRNNPGRVDGAALIRAERLMQIESHGYDAKHDDAHKPGELIQAAICYAEHVWQPSERAGAPLMWPWDAEEWHPHEDPEWNLIKAGALLAAAIDCELRKRRAARRQSPTTPTAEEPTAKATGTNDHDEP